MFLRQLINFVTIKQDNGQDVLVKYMLTHRESDKFGVLAEKHIITGSEILFEEECETLGSYSLREALIIAGKYTSGKVLPTTYLEIEEDLRREKAEI